MADVMYVKFNSLISIKPDFCGQKCIYIQLLNCKVILEDSLEQMFENKVFSDVFSVYLHKLSMIRDVVSVINVRRKKILQ